MKSSYFLGMNNEMNSKILSIVKEKIDNIRTVKKSPAQRQSLLHIRLSDKHRARSPSSKLNYSGIKSLDFSKIIRVGKEIVNSNSKRISTTDANNRSNHNFSHSFLLPPIQSSLKPTN